MPTPTWGQFVLVFPGPVGALRSTHRAQSCQQGRTRLAAVVKSASEIDVYVSFTGARSAPCHKRPPVVPAISPSHRPIKRCPRMCRLVFVALLAAARCPLQRVSQQLAASEHYAQTWVNFFDFATRHWAPNSRSKRRRELGRLV